MATLRRGQQHTPLRKRTACVTTWLVPFWSARRNVSPDVSPLSQSPATSIQEDASSYFLPSQSPTKPKPIHPYSLASSLIREFLSSQRFLRGGSSMSRLMGAMLLGGARVTAVSKKAPPRTAYFPPPRPQPVTWSRLCLQTAPRSSQVFSTLSPR
jgi:hypothetical protein